jgi:NAD(P)-dependent dehydrogenase (short-subunit alcohol dehydrogenase family)
MAANSRLEGRVAVVTGGSRGIGRATALALSARGADVAVVAQSDDAAEKTAGAIRSSGRRALAIGCDVASWAAVDRMVARVASELGPPTILLNAAGISGEKGLIVDLPPEVYERILAVNVLGPFHLMKAVLPHMQSRQQGVVINMTSSAGQRPRATRCMYGSTKAALDVLAATAALEVAGAGIRVYAVSPGLIDTDMNAHDYATMPPDEQAQRKARIDSGEMRPPEEPGAFMAWLATDAAAGFKDVNIRWPDPDVRQRLRQLPDFPEGL